MDFENIPALTFRLFSFAELVVLYTSERLRRVAFSLPCNARELYESYSKEASNVALRESRFESERSES